MICKRLWGHGGSSGEKVEVMKEVGETEERWAVRRERMVDSWGEKGV